MKKVIITGASKGIGKAIATNLLKQKFGVIGISRSHTIKHKNYIPIVHDLYITKGYKEKLDDIIKKHNDIEAVISNAGNGLFENLENIPSNDIVPFFNLNLLSHILISKYLVGYFKKRKRGQFIFMGSEAASEASQKSTIYSTAKHGLVGFTKALRAECSKSNIRVTIINPGMVRSSFFNNLSFQPGDKKENAISKKDLSDLILFLLKTSNSINYLNINLAPLKKVIDFKNK
tara:strand:+ start:241 stop:936 length:696 start_codon:yes stop_codon:yes gene_type:complete